MLGETFNVSDLSFVQANPPPDYASALESIAPNITTLAAENRQSDEPWYESLIRLVPAIVASDQQRKLLSIQVERAKQGLPPLDASQYGLGVNVGLSPDTRQVLIWGGVALIGLAALGVLRIGRS